MTSQPVGEHHTGSLNLTGQGNPEPEQLPNDIDPAALEAATKAHIENAGWDWNDLGNDHLDHEASKAVLLADMRVALRAAYPAIRQQVADEIAAALDAVPAEVYPEDIFPPDGTSIDCQSARVMRHAYPAAARIAREIGRGANPTATPENHTPTGIMRTDVGPFIRCSCGNNPTPNYWLRAHWPGDKAEGQRLLQDLARESGGGQ